MILLVGACGAASPRSAAPLCTRPSITRVPLPRGELERAFVPTDLAAVRAQIAGIWDGDLFDIDGELGSGPPTASSGRTFCLDADGAMTILEDHPPPAQTGCRPRTRTFAIERDENADTNLVVTTLGGCPGAASYEAPYTMRYTIHRLDDGALVLVDASTASVSGFRRR